MGVKAKPVNAKDYKDTPKSSLSKQQYITKPEVRNGVSHNYSVSQAESKLRKIHS